MEIDICVMQNGECFWAMESGLKNTPAGLFKAEEIAREWSLLDGVEWAAVEDPDDGTAGPLSAFRNGESVHPDTLQPN
jgi:hypothetical protein